MARERSAAVRDSVEICLCPVPGSVESNRKPKVAAPPKQKAEQETAQEQVQNPKPGLSRVVEVAVSEDRGRHDRGGPEPDTSGQPVQKVAAVLELFLHSDDQEGKRVNDA